MFDCADVPTTQADSLGDPRLDERHVRCLPGHHGVGTTLLVGVVHDHPASVFRAVRLIEAVAPETLALELPPLAVALFKLYGRDRFVPPRLGGEMSAAIQAAGDASTVGIDAPNATYLRLLVTGLLTDPPPPSVVGAVTRDLLSGLSHAVACRLGAYVGAVTPVRPQLYSHIEYDCSLLDTPSTQASHEASHLSQRQFFLRAIETPPAIERIDTAREASMVERLRDLRAAGDVVAVVGTEHLDAVASGLGADTQP